MTGIQAIAPPPVGAPAAAKSEGAPLPRPEPPPLPAPSAARGETTGAPRWHIDATALGVLEHVFSLDHFPNVETRKKLGDDLNV